MSERLLRSGDRLDQTDRTLQQMVSGEPFVPETLEIFLTSNCNFKCIYCNPKISSAWRQEISIYGALDLGAGHILHAPETTDLRRRSSPDGPAALESAFWEWWPTLRSRVRRLKLTGGEPLLSPTTLEFLKRIEREGFPQGELSVNTNLGVSALVMDRFLNALTLSRPAMNRLVIQTSMEAVGDRAEYLRTGLKWDEWQTNLQRLLKSDVVDQVVITSTMNVLCALYYQEFIEFVKELNRCYPGKLIVSAPWLVSPEFLAVEILPRHLVPHLEGLSESAEGCSAFGATAQSQIQNLERFFTTRPEQPRDVFKRRQLGLYLQALDQRRHSSAQRAFPLLASF